MIQHYTAVLQKYAVFSGRATRPEYWWFFLANILISIILGIIDGALGLLDVGIADVYSLAVLVPGIAVAIRRVQDVGKSGWFILIPIYNIILMATEGEQGANQYGPDPRNPEADITDHLVE